MHMSKLFSQTLRDKPSEADVSSHELMLRGGYMRQLAAGIFSYLPLAKRALTKIENIMREEINAIGGQEITMPVVHPADLWKETGRWYQIGSEMGRFKDKTDRDMVLAMTHEEVVADLVRKEIHSYRQLPSLIYHIQTKWRDDPRPRAGLIRAREFTMLDSYSLDADAEGLQIQYRAHYQAYFNIFNRCGLPVTAVKSDVGMMGGSLAHEFMYLTPVGEDTVMACRQCGYSANRQVARFAKPSPQDEEPGPLEKVATPNVTTIEELARFLNVPRARTAKAVFMMATVTEELQDQERLLFAIVRGDMEVNETKLANAVKAKDLRPAVEHEIAAAGAVPGYASPVGLQGTLVVVDDAVPHAPNLVAGANQEGFHLLNVNYGRDYTAEIIADITLAQSSDPCPVCESPLEALRGIEVGNIFMLGTRYSESLGCTYLDQQGQARPVVMGSYGIGSGRLLASVAEEHHDEHGLKWPISVAPYQIHLVALRGGEQHAGRVDEELRSHGLEVLYDDREESPGVKFMDADLIGLPLRLTVSKRSLERGGVEVKLRGEQDSEIVALDALLDVVEQRILGLWEQLSKGGAEVPYQG